MTNPQDEIQVEWHAAESGNVLLPDGSKVEVAMGDSLVGYMDGGTLRVTNVIKATMQ